MNMASLAHRPVRWPTLSRDTLSSRNVLCRHRDPWAVTWLDQPWQLAMQPATRVPVAVRYLEVEWGGSRVFIGLGQAVIDAISAVALPGESVLRWPQDVAMAAIEFSAELLSVSVETATRKSLQCTGWSSRRPDDESLERFCWSATGEQTRLEGEFWLDPVACRYLAAQLREHPATPDPSAAIDWAGLCLPLQLVVGWVDLPASMLAGIERRDVMVLDECLMDGTRQQLLVCLGPRHGFLGELQGNQLRVTEGVKEIMSDSDPDTSAASHLLDDIAVRLTFDVGDREITLGDLRSIQPGYVFNLGRDPKSLVSIRANGRLVGEGELVDIEGRLGVSVLRFRSEGS